MSHKIRALVVDDHPLFREGVVRTFGENDIEVVGQAATTEEALQLMRTVAADILLLDVDIPGGGLVCAQQVTGLYPAMKIVMLTGSDNGVHLVEALKAGARGYVLKGVPGRELINIIREVMAGASYAPPALANNLLFAKYGNQASPDQTQQLLEGLTGREREILELVAAGHSNREIGQKLFLSENTVKQYMTNILQKLQVRNRVEAAMLVQTRSQTAGKMPG